MDGAGCPAQPSWECGACPVLGERGGRFGAAGGAAVEDAGAALQDTPLVQQCRVQLYRATGRLTGLGTLASLHRA